ncbi:hypothetical protein SK128_002619 [Halocaridina rubra]|uniref:Uncharacterized protein n=1 Tax=Halocaridina rubra TaxID=373956 RepID=A0AAN9FV13_HALRR
MNHHLISVLCFHSSGTSKYFPWHHTITFNVQWYMIPVLCVTMEVIILVMEIHTGFFRSFLFC